MDKDQKYKLEKWKHKAKIKEQKQRLKNNVLLQECLAALDDFKILESDKEKGSIVDKVSGGILVLNGRKGQFILLFEFGLVANTLKDTDGFFNCKLHQRLGIVPTIMREAS